MGVRLRGLAVASIATAAILVTPGAAQAAAPAPLCESGAGLMHCSAEEGQAPFTWTITYQPTGVTTTVVTGGFLRRGCGAQHALSHVSYSYVDANGTTVSSEVAGVLCNRGPWP